MTKIKMCGFTRESDVLHANRAGADAIGFIFYPPSPRCIDIETANALTKVVAPFSVSVGLFVDQSEAVVREVVAQVPLDLLQFHGNESADYCASFGMPYIKVLKLGIAEDVESVKARLFQGIGAHTHAQGFLIDTMIDGKAGGTGQRFDWDILRKALEDVDLKSQTARQPLVIAGGLNAENVASCVSLLSPYAVDVSSGIEESPGKKSASKIHSFTENVSSASALA